MVRGAPPPLRSACVFVCKSAAEQWPERRRAEVRCLVPRRTKRAVFKDKDADRIDPVASPIDPPGRCCWVRRHSGE